MSITQRRKLGAAFVPEERLGHGTAPRMRLSENALLTGHAASGMVQHGFVNTAATLATVDRATEAFDVRKAKRDPEAASLSGGNLQKFIVGREILRNPAVLVVSQPTWGVDAGAAAVIRQALLDLAANGAAVLVTSQDLDELAEIADRIAVMFHGRLSAAAGDRGRQPREARPADGWKQSGAKGSGACSWCLKSAPSDRTLIALVSPLIAIGLTIVTMSILFAILGKNPISALGVYFIDPLTDSYSLQEIAVKATPLVMIAIGLSLCYLANVWNIGAEGQFLIGAVAGSWLAVKTQGTDAGPLGVAGDARCSARAAGALYALIPAICKVRFGASEILTSLMLVYVADLFLDYLVRGPWRDPAGFNFPTTAEFDPVATVPILIEGGRLHLGAIIALVVVAAATVLLGRTIKGFEIRVVGAAPRAARFGGFNSNQLVLLTFAISGALAGLAGIIEVAGPIGHLQPGISPGYGFTAIIVAFLGRLNPVGILIAGLFLALTFIGGEQAQIAMKIPLDVTKVFQGILLFYVLACDSLILYRFRLIFASRKVPVELLEAIILSVLAASTPLLLAATGELVTERSGVLNLGVEGMMIVGAACGFGGAWLTGSIIVGALCGIVAGALLSPGVRAA